LFFDTEHLDLPNVERLIPFRIGQKEIPRQFSIQCRHPHQSLKQAGFIGARVYFIHDPITVPRLMLWYRHQSGKCIAQLQIIEAISDESGDSEFVVTLNIVSALDQGQFATTTNSRAEQFGSESVQITQMIGGSVEELLQRHGTKFELTNAAPIMNNDAVEQVAEAWLGELTDTLLQENVFRPRQANHFDGQLIGSRHDADDQDSYEEPVTVADLASSTNSTIVDSAHQRVSNPYDPVTQTGTPFRTDGLVKLDDRHRKILSEIELIQSKKSSALSSLLLLGVSIAVFIGAGFLAWNLRFVLLLIPILLFHELGHFVAMRFFKYKNVKMFFIPLLGAAVSGRSFNVDGWKKVIVSLAGPLPGLLLSIPLAIAAAYFNIPILREATLLTIVLNLFNLIPFVPLDGGWVMHALLFCRHPWLDAIFRITAGVGLILGGILLGSIFLGVFGAFMMLGIPLIFQNSKIARSLRDRHVPSKSKDEQSIPAETAKLIIDELPTTGPQAHPKHAAQSTLQIFEIINTRPPGIGASIGLTALYLASWMAGIAAILILLAGHTFHNFAAGNSSPAIAVSASEIQRANQLNTQDFESLGLLIGVFENEDDAKSTFEQVKPSQLPVALFGRSVWAAYDSSDEKKFAEPLFQIENRATKTFPTDPGDHAMISITCVAPDEATAKKLKLGLEVYFDHGSPGYAIEPWANERPLTEAQIKSRETLQRILEVQPDLRNDPQMVKQREFLNGELEKELNEEEYEKLFDDDAVVQNRIRAEFFSRLKSESDWDEKLIDAFLHEPTIDVQTDQWTDEDHKAQVQLERDHRLAIARMLGQLPLDPITNEPTITDAKLAAAGGSIRTQGSELKMNFMTFNQPIDAVPVMIRWLSDNGCTEFEIQSGFSVSMLFGNHSLEETTEE